MHCALYVLKQCITGKCSKFIFDIFMQYIENKFIFVNNTDIINRITTLTNNEKL